MRRIRLGALLLLAAGALCTPAAATEDAEEFVPPFREITSVPAPIEPVTESDEPGFMPFPTNDPAGLIATMNALFQQDLKGDVQAFYMVDGEPQLHVRNFLQHLRKEKYPKDEERFPDIDADHIPAFKRENKIPQTAEYIPFARLAEGLVRPGVTKTDVVEVKDEEITRLRRELAAAKQALNELHAVNQRLQEQQQNFDAQLIVAVRKLMKENECVVRAFGPPGVR